MKIHVLRRASGHAFSVARVIDPRQHDQKPEPAESKAVVTDSKGKLPIHGVDTDAIRKRWQRDVEESKASLPTVDQLFGGGD